ncbi:MAG TPA: FAD-dependent oxidoreductase [Xanthomonadaceae bacterium]|nr:FAD-dependent oxidoreductase [Xanthomonadaceae bacterium]
MSTAKTIPPWSLPREFTQARFRDAVPASPQDVVIVGAGVAGLCTALGLAREGRQVLVLDRQGVGEGESGRTTAHLASALDDRYYHLASWHGEDGARLAAESHAAAIDWIEAFARKRTGGLGFARVPGYLFAHDGDIGRLEKERDAARAAGLDVTMESGIPQLPAFGPALRFDRQARIDMGLYLHALAQACDDAGVAFCKADAVDAEGGAQPSVALRNGNRLQAATVVLATNVPFHERVPVHTKQAPYRTYVVAGRIARDALPDALVWDDGDPYHYIRLAEDPDTGGPLVLVGGEDHKTGQDHDPTAYVRLQEWARAHLPGIGEFVYGWSGQVLEPADGVGFIGADPGGEDNVYIVTGDSGNGVTHGTLAGLLLRESIAGRNHRWAPLYDPRRKQLHSPLGWLRENANVALQYRDWLSPGDVAEVEALAPGEGAVVRSGLHRVAVYREGEGGLVAFSARCPHLGCSVRWSPQEKSWDCPCHGSRFDARTGEVLNGPANAPLAPWDEHRT